MWFVNKACLCFYVCWLYWNGMQHKTWLAVYVCRLMMCSGGCLFFSHWHFLAGETNLFCQWMRYMYWSAWQINDKVLSNFKCFIEIFSIFVTLSLSLQMELSKWVKLKKDIPIPYSFLSSLNYFGAGFSYCKYSVQ